MESIQEHLHNCPSNEKMELRCSILSNVCSALLKYAACNIESLGR